MNIVFIFLLDLFMILVIHIILSNALFIAGIVTLVDTQMVHNYSLNCACITNYILSSLLNIMSALNNKSTVVPTPLDRSKV